MLPQLNLQGHQPGLPRTPVYDAIAGYASGGEVVAPGGYASGGEVVAPGGRSKYEYASQLQQTINDLRRIGTQDALAQAREIQRELLALMRPQEDATPPVPPPLDPNAPNDPQALEQRRANSAPTPAPLTVPADPAPLPGDMDPTPPEGSRPTDPTAMRIEAERARRMGTPGSTAYAASLDGQRAAADAPAPDLLPKPSAPVVDLIAGMSDRPVGGPPRTAYDMPPTPSAGQMPSDPQKLRIEAERARRMGTPDSLAYAAAIDAVLAATDTPSPAQATNAPPADPSAPNDPQALEQRRANSGGGIRSLPPRAGAPASTPRSYTPADPMTEDPMAAARAQMADERATGRSSLVELARRFLETAPGASGQPGWSGVSAALSGRNPLDATQPPSSTASGYETGSDFPPQGTASGYEAGSDFPASGPAGAPARAPAAPPSPAARLQGAASPRVDGAPAGAPQRGGITSLVDQGETGGFPEIPSAAPGSAIPPAAAAAAAAAGDKKGGFLDGMTEEQATFLMELGLGMLSSNSPYWSVALGEGGSKAMQSMRADRKTKADQQRDERRDALDEKYKLGSLDVAKDRNAISREELTAQTDLGWGKMFSQEGIAKINEGGAWARAKLAAGAQLRVAEIGSDARLSAAALAAGAEALKAGRVDPKHITDAIDNMWNTFSDKEGKTLQGSNEMGPTIRQKAAEWTAYYLTPEGGARNVNEAAQMAYGTLQKYTVNHGPGNWFGQNGIAPAPGKTLPNAPARGAPLPAADAANPMGLQRPTR
jgi:hypothetical protein